MDIDDRASRPSVTLVNGIAMPIDLQRAVKVRSGLDWTLAVVLDFAAPENRLSLFIGGLQLEPDIESVHSAAGEEVSDLASAHHHVDALVIAAANCGIRAIDRSGAGTDLG